MKENSLNHQKTLLHTKFYLERHHGSAHTTCIITWYLSELKTQDKAISQTHVTSDARTEHHRSKQKG